jgi:DNA-directed RNA polymerase specialized sigma24 family protein
MASKVGACMDDDFGGLVRRALAGDVRALRSLVDTLTPVVQARVARALLRGSARRGQGRDLRQHVEDFTQEVFVSLFDDDARALRSWDHARGLSLVNFVGLMAEHQVASILRSGKRSPWTEEPTACATIDRVAGVADELHGSVCSRELLAKLLVRLYAELSPRDFQLFQLLLIEERAAGDACSETGMSLNAVYQWKSRHGKLVRQWLRELEDSDDTPNPNGSPVSTREICSTMRDPCC